MKQWIERAVCIFIGCILALSVIHPSEIGLLKAKIASQDMEIARLEAVVERREEEAPKESEKITRVGASATKATSSLQVYVTPSGEKYHKAGCQYIKNKDKSCLRTFSSPEEAEKHGYAPCSKCFK